MTPRRTELNVRGFLCLSSSPALSTAQVAHSFADVLHLSGISEVQVLTPQSPNGLEKNRYSGLYGTEAFPLHTDMAHWHIPPRYFLLRCIEPAEDVHTQITHCRDVIGPEADLTLRRALFRPRRRQDGRLNCLRLREEECYRWDPMFIQPVNALAEDLKLRIMTRVSSVGRHMVSLSTPGDCILIDNWKVLHGRSAVPPTAMHRKLERAYLGSLRI